MLHVRPAKRHGRRTASRAGPPVGLNTPLKKGEKRRKITAATGPPYMALRGCARKKITGSASPPSGQSKGYALDAAPVPKLPGKDPQHCRLPNLEQWICSPGAADLPLAHYCRRSWADCRWAGQWRGGRTKAVAGARRPRVSAREAEKHQTDAGAPGRRHAMPAAQPSDAGLSRDEISPIKLARLHTSSPNGITLITRALKQPRPRG